MHLVLIWTHQRPRRPHKKQQNMQLPTEEYIPAQRKLPTIVCHLPSQALGVTITPPKHTSDLMKTTSRQDTETTPPHSDTRVRNSTELSKHIWTLKDSNVKHFISWRILSSSSPYNSASKRCNLSLREKFLICQPELSMLNKRNELVSSCRNRNKALLRNS